jgi:hypothetical protein
VEALLKSGGHSTLLSSFLYRVVEERRFGWRERLERCLGIREYAWAASIQVLRLAEPPEDLLELALDVTEPQAVETACLQGEVPTATLRRLLTNNDPRIAGAAAIGEWSAEPYQSVREEVTKEWRNVVLRMRESELGDRPDAERWLQEVFWKAPDLAFAWLRGQLALGAEEPLLSVSEHGVVATAARALDPSHRARLLKKLAPEALSESVLSLLVDGSPHLYRQLLSRSDLRKHHLAPLAGKPPDKQWIALARLALEAGYTPQDVAGASLHFPNGFSPSVEHYARWETAFRDLLGMEDPALQEFARHGLREAERLISEEREVKRRFALTGRL